MSPMDLMEEGLLVTTFTPQWLFHIAAGAAYILLHIAAFYLAFRLIRVLIKRVNDSLDERAWQNHYDDNHDNRRKIARARNRLRRRFGEDALG